MFKTANELNPHQVALKEANFVDASRRSTYTSTVFSHITVSGFSLDVINNSQLLFEMMSALLVALRVPGFHGGIIMQCMTPLIVQETVNVQLDTAGAVSPRYKSSQHPTLLFKLLQPVPSYIQSCSQRVQTAKKTSFVACTYLDENDATAIMTCACEIGAFRPLPHPILHVIYKATMNHLCASTSVPLIGIVMVVEQTVRTQKKNGSKNTITPREYALVIFSQHHLIHDE